VITSGVLCREFFGRSTEMAFLRDRAFSHHKGRGGVIVLRGSAGIGKSRLVDEFVSTARTMKASVGVGRAREFANAPYLAVDEALL
jgi:hypothetical protein